MNEEDKPIPEGMKRYTMLGLSIVAPDGIPEELIGAIIEGMVQSGHVVFDPVTNTLKNNPDIIDGEIQGLSMQVDGLGNVVNSRALSRNEIKDDLGIDEINFNKPPRRKL